MAARSPKAIPVRERVLPHVRIVNVIRIRREDLSALLAPMPP